MDEVGALIRRHFDEEVRAVRVPGAVLPQREGKLGQAGRVPAHVVDFAARAAAVLVAAGALALLAATLGRPAALQDAVAAAVREKAVERVMPDPGVVLDMIDASFGLVRGKKEAR